MLKLRIEQDQDAENPRTAFDEACLIYIPRGNRYLTGDKDAQENPPKGSVVLRLFAYVHGGVTVRVGDANPFSCPWDSGQVGIAYVPPEKGREEWGRTWRKQAEACIRAEVKTWDAYLTGDVWGYVIEDETGEVIDSCWGFYGRESVESEGQSALKYETERREKDEAKEAVERERAACADIATV